MNRLMTVAEVSELLQISKPTIYRWAETKEIPSFRLGNRRRFYYHDVAEWVRKKKEEA